MCPAAVVDLRLVGFLSQPCLAITHRKTLLCHQPNVPLKEQFPGAPDWPLTQILLQSFLWLEETWERLG